MLTPSTPPPPERQRAVQYRGHTRHPQARRTLQLVAERKVDPAQVLAPPMWICRWTSELGPERIEFFGPNEAAARQLAHTLARYNHVLAIVEQITPPQQGETQ